MSNINPVTEASVEATPLPPQPAVTNPVGTAAPILPVEDKPLPWAVTSSSRDSFWAPAATT